MVYWGILFEAFRLFGDSLVNRAREAECLRMADGLMTLVDELNLKGGSPLAREVLGVEAEGAGGRS